MFHFEGVNLFGQEGVLLQYFLGYLSLKLIKVWSLLVLSRAAIESVNLKIDSLINTAVSILCVALFKLFFQRNFFSPKNKGKLLLKSFLVLQVIASTIRPWKS